jgi:hypothetical protein
MGIRGVGSNEFREEVSSRSPRREGDEVKFTRAESRVHPD